MDPSGWGGGGVGIDGVACRAPTASAGLNVGLFPFIAWIQHSLSPAQLPGVRHSHPNHGPRQRAQPGTGHANGVTRSQRRRRRRVFSSMSETSLTPELRHSQGAAWRSHTGTAGEYLHTYLQAQRSDLRGSLPHRLASGKLKILFTAWKGFPMKTHFTATFFLAAQVV